MSHTEELPPEGDATHEAAADLLTAWLLNTDTDAGLDAESLTLQWTRDLVLNTPDNPLDWRDEHRNLAGRTSEQFPIPWPSFDSVMRHFQHPDGDSEFVAVGIRVDHGDVLNFVDGMHLALADSPVPRIPGKVTTSDDDTSCYLSAVLDLNFVEFGGAAAVDRLARELFAPVDHWRSTLGN